MPSVHRRGHRRRPFDWVGEHGSYRFTHALTRDAVEATLGTADRVAVHRSVAEAIEAQFADDLSEHLGGLARHWI